VRLLSYNIHKGIGGRDRRYRLERVMEVIELENPDLICLQEVDRNVRRSRFHDQPKLMADYFNSADWLFQVNVHLTTGGYGNLLLSRWPLETRHQISLRLRDKKPRGAQIAAVITPEGPLHLVHFHLGLAERERHWQVAHLLNHAMFREAADLPTLIVGDSNDWRNTLAGGRLAQERFTQATAPPSRFRSFPAYMPVGSLDKAFYRGDITVRHVRIAHSPLSRQASDHLPLVIDFHLGATPLESLTAMPDDQGGPQPAL
jgi:endonuclease/exonuclease/phosphatase family metal-dependent hydrolase